MIIVQAGMYRSGTTWQFNAVRVAFEVAGKPIQSGHWDGEFPDSVGREIHLIKIIKPFERLAEMADYIVSTKRDASEIRASMLRRAEFLKVHPDPRFGNEAKVEKFNLFMSRARWWEGVAHYIQDFDLIRADPLRLIRDYVALFGLQVDPQAVLEELNRQMVVPTEGYDKRTLLHAGHITKEG